MVHCSYLELLLLMYKEVLEMLYLIFLVQGSKSSKLEVRLQFSTLFSPHSANTVHLIKSDGTKCLRTVPACNYVESILLHM